MTTAFQTSHTTVPLDKATAAKVAATAAARW
jgi:hypothetical protein